MYKLLFILLLTNYSYCEIIVDINSVLFNEIEKISEKTNETNYKVVSNSLFFAENNINNISISLLKENEIYSLYENNIQNSSDIVNKNNIIPQKIIKQGDKNTILSSPFKIGLFQNSLYLDTYILLNNDIIFNSTELINNNIDIIEKYCSEIK